MATRAHDRLNQWLRDAHAMERQADQMLTAQAGRIESYPEVKSRIEEHIKETRAQARRIEACLKSRGDDPSAFKDIGGQLLAMAQGASGMFAGDEIMKGALASYTFEHMEIASYRIIIAAAEALGDEETVAACTENLEEELAMAAWLEENIASLTQEFLDREENPYAEAKR